MNLGEAVSKPTTSSRNASDTLSAEGHIFKGSSYEEKNVTCLFHQMKNIEIDPKEDGDRKLNSKHSINQPCIAARKEMNASSDVPKAWDLGDCAAGETKQLDGSWGSWDTAHKVSPSLQNWWQWFARAGKPAPHISSQVENHDLNLQHESFSADDPEFDELLPQDVGGGVDVDDDLLDDSEDDFSDGFYSDDSQKSHDTRKKNKWLRPFFESLDNLSLEQINEQARQWHCPACQDGPGAINWYTGLQALMAHARTKGRIRMRLHRELAEVLEEELQRRGTSILPAGEAFGKWWGLCEMAADHEIVWPPMVVVMNTILEKDEKDKWKGMGNQELLEYFSTYDAVKARHSYGPNGHRGMSVLIFEASAMGYLEAERLHKQFRGEGRDRDAWERHPTLFYPGGKRQLYGSLASKEDLVIFNQHSHGKGCLKFDVRSYQEMVLGPMKQMSENNQKLIWLKNKIVKQEQRSKVLKETFEVVSQKLRDTFDENRIVRHKMKIQHEENKEEMDYQGKFVKEQMDKINKIKEDKEMAFENLLQERAKANQFDVNFGTIVDCKQRNEEIKKFISSQLKEIEEFEAERIKLMRAYEEKKTELKRKHLTEEIELEKNFDAELTKLMEKYAQPTLSNLK
ncbi:protein SUPPRESSOR OF GENE SILENCING 3 homolog isoform X2 [Phalaenopsis equestris]|nr:protein SUPPRESSOR OF GENE SILENCING 3 homolog isoform X2 [Phalaenopsis equestris]XP_020589104.1 protein SUPPRESSOR OF GENE SILENCING 3 homolog isoform X2 [Phalaenopsis equestris]